MDLSVRLPISTEPPDIAIVDRIEVGAAALASSRRERVPPPERVFTFEFENLEPMHVYHLTLIKPGDSRQSEVRMALDGWVIGPYPEHVGGSPGWLGRAPRSSAPRSRTLAFLHMENPGALLRAREKAGPRIRASVLWHSLIVPSDFLMAGSMMRGIKRRAEATRLRSGQPRAVRTTHCRGQSRSISASRS